MSFQRYVDPELIAGLEAVANTRIPEELDTIVAFRELERSMLESMAQVLPHSDAVLTEDHYAQGPENAPDILIRLYKPAKTPDPLPVVYFIHGGGMIAGSVAASDWYCEGLVEGTGYAVASVEYRLAPEHPFPKPLDDCYAGLLWLEENAISLGLDMTRLAVAGASAGGGIAAGLVLKVRDQGGPSISFQYLMYPMLDDREMTKSSREFSRTPTWSRENNRNGWHALLGPLHKSDNVSYYAAPARANDLSGLPPTLIQVGELDVFRDEDIDYAVRLMQAGVSTEIHVYPGAYHGWELVNPLAGSSARVYQERNSAICNALETWKTTEDHVS